jgi:hypothetical protein
VALWDGTEIRVELITRLHSAAQILSEFGVDPTRQDADGGPDG